MALHNDVLEAFKQGEIPAAFIEEQELLPEDAPAAESFIATISPIYNRLLSAMGENPEDHPVRFRLSASNSPNAFIVTKTAPPLIVMTAGMIKAVENESELAGVLAHELGHDFLHQKLGDHENGKPEEMGADIFAVNLLRKANYPQDALRKTLSRFDQKTNMLGNLLDPHPAIETRIPVLKTAERAQVRGETGKGEQQDFDDQPVAKSLKEAVSNLSYKGYVRKLLDKEGFYEAEEQDKAAILKKLLEEGLSDTDYYYKQSRIKDLADAMKQVKEAANPEAFNALVDTIILHVSKDVLPHYYVPLQTGKNYAMGWRPDPIGSMKILQDTIHRFMAATTPEAIQQEADNVNSLLSRYPAESNIDSITIKGFSHPENMGSVATPVNPPWHAHANEALQGNMKVAEALTRLGGVIWLDPRLAHLDEQMAEIPSLRNSGLSVSKESTPLINKEGQICGILDDKATDNRIQWEKETLQERAKEEQSILDQVDWNRVEEDFDRFTEDYAKHLRPRTSLVYAHVAFTDGHYPFAERFLAQAKNILDAHPDNIEFKDKLTNYLVNSVTQVFRDKKPEEGLSTAHPFSAFILEDPEGLFTTEHKIKALTSARLYKDAEDVTHEPEQLWCLPHEKIFPGLPKRTLAELKEWITIDLQDIAEKIGERDFKSKDILVDIIRYETLRTIKQEGAINNLSDLAFFREITHSKTTSYLEGIDNRLDSLREHFTNAYYQSALADKSTADTSKLIEEFTLLAAERKGEAEYVASRFYRPSLFMEYPDLRDTYQTRIKEIAQSVPPEEHMTLLEGLLFQRNIPVKDAQPLLLLEKYSRSEEGIFTPLHYDGALADPDFKGWAVKGYASAIASSLGVDDGSAAYASRFKTKINQITASASAATAIAVLQEMSRKTCGNQMLLQPECASYIKETIESSNLGEAVKQNFQATIGEGALLALSSTAERREATVDFLTRPFSKEHAEEFKEKIKQQEADSATFSFEAFISPQAGNKLFGQFLSENARTEQIHSFHKTFWDLPFEMRMLAIKQVIFKESSKGKKADPLEKQLEFALDKTLPANDNPENQSARQVVDAYLEATPNEEDKCLIASAMLVANPPSDKALQEKMSVGKGLNLVLGAIDPAGDKVKQAIESHPSTPESIREDFKDSKTAAKDPLRHQIIDWVTQSNEALPEHQKIVRVGKVLGAGSYGITVEGEMPDGSVIARTLLYPYVREKAENEFAILEKAAAILTEKDPVFAPVQEMIRQAANMSHIETDMDIAAKQAEIAAKLYNGMKVTVEGEEFTFEAAEYLGHGQNHKDFKIIEGKHFNEITAEATTPAEKAHARRLAKAQMTAEISILLSGKPFDHDRHGGQQRITGNHIGQFDFGAMATTAPSDRQKQMIGHVLGGIIKQHFVMGRPLDQALRSEMERVPTTETEKDFLSSVERGMLALGNFNAGLGEETGLGDILGAAYVNNQIDPVIEEAMNDRLRTVSKQVFKQLRHMGNHSGIKLEMPENHFEKNPDSTELQKPPKESFAEKVPIRPRHIREALQNQFGHGADSAQDEGVLSRTEHTQNGRDKVLHVERMQQTPGDALPQTRYKLYPSAADKDNQAERSR